MKLIHTFFLIALFYLGAETTLKAQFQVNAFPKNETDSLFNYSTNHYDLQYNVERHYDVNCMDSFKQYSNTTGPFQQQFITFPIGTTSKQPLGRMRDLRPQTILTKTLQGGSWSNYAEFINQKFSNSCFDSISYGLSWTGNWDTSSGTKSIGTFLPNGNPSHVIEKEYDNSTGIWYNYTDKYYNYTSSNILQSIHYRLWATFSSSVYFDYVDSNFSFSNYTNLCDSHIDTVVVYKKIGGTYMPESRTTKTQFPYEGYMMEYATKNGTAWVNSMKYEQYYDIHGNDSIYKQWYWNSTTNQYDLGTYYSYSNTYDINGNLITQELFKNLLSATPNVLYKYSKVKFSNYVNCGTPTTVQNLNDEKFNFIVTPNPSQGHFKVVIPQFDSKPLRIIIQDLTGRIVYRQVISSSTISVQLQQPKGMYLFTITEGLKSSTQKLIIE